MPRFNYAQLQGLWINAGGNKQVAPLMAAIALAESGGDSNAHNPSGATGLWQILGACAGTGTPSFDPATNARQAVCKYNSQGICAWQTWSGQGCSSPGSYTGTYRQYLQGNVPPDLNVPANGTAAAQANTASANAGAGGGGGGNFVCQAISHTPLFGSFAKDVCETASGALNPMTWVEAFVKGIINPLIQYVAGAFGMLAGGGLMIAGIYGLVSSSNAGQQVIGEAEKGAGAAVAVGGLATGQPEVAAAGAPAMEQGAARQRAGRQGAQAARATRIQNQRMRLAQQREQRLSTEQQLRMQAGQYRQREV